MKVYTIIDHFDDDGGSLWMANFHYENEAKKCFECLLKHYGMIDGNGFVKFVDGDEEKWKDKKLCPSKLFDQIVSNGEHYNYHKSIGMYGQLFVREEVVQNFFNEEEMPFV